MVHALWQKCCGCNRTFSCMRFHLCGSTCGGESSNPIDPLGHQEIRSTCECSTTTIWQWCVSPQPPDAFRGGDPHNLSTVRTQVNSDKAHTFPETCALQLQVEYIHGQATCTVGVHASPNTAVHWRMVIGGSCLHCRVPRQVACYNNCTWRDKSVDLS
jgi:hypothetical protein